MNVLFLMMSRYQPFVGRGNSFFIPLNAGHFVRAEQTRDCPSLSRGPCRCRGDLAPALECGKFVFLHSAW